MSSEGLKKCFLYKTKPNKLQNLWAYGWGRKKEKLEGQRLTLLVHLLDHTRENISSKNNKKENPMTCNMFYYISTYKNNFDSKLFDTYIHSSKKKLQIEVSCPIHMLRKKKEFKIAFLT